MIDYTITLVNDGNVDITNATLTDTVEGYPTQTLTSHTGDTTNPGTLDVNETWTYAAPRTYTYSDLKVGDRIAVGYNSDNPSTVYSMYRVDPRVEVRIK